MRRQGLIACTLATSIILTGCTSLSSLERETLMKVVADGYEEDAVKRKDQTTAAVLNILPGVGNFYLAPGDNNEHIWVGVANLLLWPISITWGIPEAAIDAKTINKKETAQAYIRGGTKEIDKQQRYYDNK
ncbi:hypothetical protein [Mucisphaera calidilacus]|uniref:Lipoprotein n=1 Tax=Mucisphaera calidilacus TaxID=2527982 RepID=A0A518BXZ9_9BACT|nr:hypothetical protein [Mucisphaera calidilacus]QDU71842.1 hypothetical protein Pan265_16960 [Mucisphaera calidilacus]